MRLPFLELFLLVPLMTLLLALVTFQTLLLALADIRRTVLSCVAVFSGGGSTRSIAVSTAGNRATGRTVSLCREGQAGKYQNGANTESFLHFWASSTPKHAGLDFVSYVNRS